MGYQAAPGSRGVHTCIECGAIVADEFIVRHDRTHRAIREAIASELCGHQDPRKPVWRCELEKGHTGYHMKDVFTWEEDTTGPFKNICGASGRGANTSCCSRNPEHKGPHRSFNGWTWWEKDPTPENGCGNINPRNDLMQCMLIAGHDGDHHMTGLTWPQEVAAPEPSPSREEVMKEIRKTLTFVASNRFLADRNKLITPELDWLGRKLDEMGVFG